MIINFRISSKMSLMKKDNSFLCQMAIGYKREVRIRKHCHHIPMKREEVDKLPTSVNISSADVTQQGTVVMMKEQSAIQDIQEKGSLRTPLK